MFTLSGFREDLLGVTIFPEVLNNHSDAELVAHTHKYFCASCEICGYWLLYVFHQGRISSSESNLGSDKYLSSSVSKICSGEIK